MPSETNNLTRADLDRFVELVEQRRTLNFPMLAAELEFSWPEVRRHLKDNLPFREKLTQVLERMSYVIHDNYMRAAMGLDDNAKLPPITAVKYVTGLLTSGVLFGDSPEEDEAVAQGASISVQDLRDKLGL